MEIKMRRFTVSIMAIALAAAPAAVLAQNATDRPTFELTDADKSGEVSYPELITQYPKITEDQFKQADGDKSSGLNATEFAALVTATDSLTQQAPAEPATTQPK
jgi:hypothetical protein